MEIIAEIIFQIIGWILQLLAELFLQVIGEAIAQWIGHGVSNTFRRLQPVAPWLAAIGYAIFGALAGAVSLWLLPDLFITAGWLRMANLLITPILAGLLMAWVGSWRRRHDKAVIRLETFACGFLFAFSMALVRHAWGH